MERTRRPTLARQERVPPSSTASSYVLRLYVAGATARSLLAVANVKAVCEQYLEGRHSLEVVDIYRHPALLRDDQIVAVPALVRRAPVPVRLMVGDLSRREMVLRGLGLVAPPS